MQKKGNKNSFMTLISLFSINLMYKYLFYSHSHNSNLIQTILISHFWLLYIFVIVTAQEDYEDDILEVDDGFTLSCEAASQFLFHFWFHFDCNTARNTETKCRKVN